MRKTLVTLMLAVPCFAAQLPGDYEVPAPQNLKAQAVFPVTYDVVSTGIMQRTITYTLPDDLTGGKKFVIALKEKGITKEGMIAFSDPGHANASCIDNAEAMTCLVKYEFGLVTKDVEAFLKSKYAGDLNLNMRLEVGRLFSNEPGGVVRYSKK